MEWSNINWPVLYAYFDVKYVCNELKNLNDEVTNYFTEVI